MVLLQQALIKPNSRSMTLPFKWPRAKQFELTSSFQIWTLVSFDEQAKLAWNDCLKLYGNTINHPNQSKSTNNPIDAQTWLSAIIANQHTCQNGFSDINLASHSNLTTHVRQLFKVAILASHFACIHRKIDIWVSGSESVNSMLGHNGCILHW